MKQKRMFRPLGLDGLEPRVAPSSAGLGTMAQVATTHGHHGGSTHQGGGHHQHGGHGNATNHGHMKK